MDGVKQQDSTPQNDSTLSFKWIKKIAQTVGQPAWQESSKVKSQSRDFRQFRFIFDEKWRSTLRLKYVGLQ